MLHPSQNTSSGAGQCERRPGIVVSGAADRPQHAAVVISNEREPTVSVRHHAREGGQAVRCLLETIRGVCVAGETRGLCREQIEVERVPLIVGRTFRVSAVRQDLPLDFVEQHTAAGLSPARGCRQFR